MAKSRNELAELERAWRLSGPSGTRRDMFKWSAITAGTLALTRPVAISAAPAATRSQVTPWRQEDIESDVTINVPLDPYGQVVTLDPHRTVNWGPFWAMFPNVWGGLVRYDENAKVQLQYATIAAPIPGAATWLPSAMSSSTEKISRSPFLSSAQPVSKSAPARQADK